MTRTAILIMIVSLLVTGCSTTSTTSSDPAADVSGQVSSGFASQKNVIVRDSSCQSTDADHFTCDLTYETPEGATADATVLVTCDPDRCVWREQ